MTRAVYQPSLLQAPAALRPHRKSAHLKILLLHLLQLCVSCSGVEAYMAIDGQVEHGLGEQTYLGMAEVYIVLVAEKGVNLNLVHCWQDACIGE